MKKQGEGKREEGKDGPASRDSSPATAAGFRGQGSVLRRWVGPAVILLAAALAVAPQLVHGSSCGHDFDFHLVSWLDAQQGWRWGIPYPHWTSSANYGAGEPRFVFYPPLTWMLGAAMGLVMPWQLVPIAITFLLLAGTGLATRALAREAIEDGAATLAGCVAIFSGYALFTAYERSAFGELAGGIWIPLLLLCLLRQRASGEVEVNGAATGRAASWRRSFDGSVTIALLIAGAWLSNAPVGVMASYMLAAVAAALAVRQRSWKPLVRASVGVVLGLGLAAVYLVPAAWEQKWVDIGEATNDPGLRVENSWLFAHHADAALASHDSELQKVSIIAAAMIALALAGIVVAWWSGRLRKSTRCARGFWLVLAAIPIVVLLLQLPISLPVWSFLPKMRFLQFPWRWLVAVEAPMGIFIAAAVWQTKRWRQIAVAAMCALVFAGMVYVAGHTWFQVCDDEDAVAPMVAVAKTGAGFVGTDEYQPQGADDTQLAQGLPGACLVTDADTSLGKVPKGDQGNDDESPVWDETQGSCDQTFPVSPVRVRGRAEHFGLLAVTDHAGYMVLRLTSYPAWQVTVNGRQVTELPKRDDGLLAVPVLEGPVILSVDWTTTPDVVAGRWITAVSLLAITGLALLPRRRKPRS
jgi:hypothetical protein